MPVLILAIASFLAVTAILVPLMPLRSTRVQSVTKETLR